jgi:hypothetical protein
MTVILGGILLAAGVMLFVLEPVFSGRGAPLYDGVDDFDEGAARRRVALTALRDLEYDRATGKLDGTDYELLKTELSREALQHLGTRGAGGGDPVVERASRELEEEIEQIRRALREGLQCGECEHLNVSGARYCGRCGEALAVGGGAS